MGTWYIMPVYGGAKRRPNVAAGHLDSDQWLPTLPIVEQPLQAFDKLPTLTDDGSRAVERRRACEAALYDSVRALDTKARKRVPARSMPDLTAVRGREGKGDPLGTPYRTDIGPPRHVEQHRPGTASGRRGLPSLEHARRYDSDLRSMAARKVVTHDAFRAQRARETAKVLGQLSRAPGS